MKKMMGMILVGLSFSVASFAQDGSAVYEKACKVCHEAGVANAPKAHNADDWAPRLATGIETLTTSVKQGKGAMPPGGMCADCSDDDYNSAIEFMSK